MASRRRRNRTRIESGRVYALLYDDLMQSDAWRALPHFARSVFAGIGAQYRGNNNGDLDFPVSKAKEYGISHKELAAAIPLLEQTGLIERTRIGKLLAGKKLCSLYALTCWQTDASEKYDQPIVLPRPASNAWARWKQPEDWSRFVRIAKQRAAGRKFQTPHGGNGSLPHVGNGEDHSHSSRAERRRVAAGPHVRDSLLDLGQGTREQVERFLAVHPYLSDVDVAVAFKWRVSQLDINRIRQSLIERLGGPTSAREIPGRASAD